MSPSHLIAVLHQRSIPTHRIPMLRYRLNLFVVVTNEYHCATNTCKYAWLCQGISQLCGIKFHQDTIVYMLFKWLLIV